jgi:hypothetical protein
MRKDGKCAYCRERVCENPDNPTPFVEEQTVVDEPPIQQNDVDEIPIGFRNKFVARIKHMRRKLNEVDTILGERMNDFIRMTT